MSTESVDRRGGIGYETRLRRRGVGRWINAAFLGLWLCGWLLGECFALWILVGGGLALVTGEPLDPRHGPVELTAAVAVGTFLLFWLALWTVGGIAAGTEFLRELWGEDRIAVAPDGLVVEWRAGPFARRRTIPRAEIIGLALLPRRGALVVDTVRERIEAARLGSDAERRDVLTALRNALALDDRARSAPALPDEWAEASTPEGATALVPSPATRRLQIRVAAILALVALCITAVFVRGAVRDRSWLPLAAIATTATIALGAGVLWLARGRNEWRIEPGRLVLQRRFGDRVTERFHATRLALTTREDSDGDDWFTLEAQSEAAAAAAAKHRKVRRRIVHRMNDDSVPRRLGTWLAQRARIPLDDRTTGEVREAERD